MSLLRLPRRRFNCSHLPIIFTCFLLNTLRPAMAAYGHDLIYKWTCEKVHGRRTFSGGCICLSKGKTVLHIDPPKQFRTSQLTVQVSNSADKFKTEKSVMVTGSRGFLDEAISLTLDLPVGKYRLQVQPSLTYTKPNSSSQIYGCFESRGQNGIFSNSILCPSIVTSIRVDPRSLPSCEGIRREIRRQSLVGELQSDEAKLPSNDVTYIAIIGASILIVFMAAGVVCWRKKPFGLWMEDEKPQCNDILRQTREDAVAWESKTLQTFATMIAVRRAEVHGSGSLHSVTCSV